MPCGDSDLEYEMPYGVGLLWELAFTIDEVGQDLSSYSIYMQVRNSKKSTGTVLIAISTDDISGSRIYIDPDQVSNAGIFFVYISPDTSKLMDVDKAWFDIVLVDPSGTPTVFMEDSYFVKKQVKTQISEF